LSPNITGNVMHGADGFHQPALTNWKK